MDELNIEFNNVIPGFNDRTRREILEGTLNNPLGGFRGYDQRVLDDVVQKFIAEYEREPTKQEELMLAMKVGGFKDIQPVVTVAEGRKLLEPLKKTHPKPPQVDVDFNDFHTARSSDTHSNFDDNVRNFDFGEHDNDVDSEIIPSEPDDEEIIPSESDDVSVQRQGQRTIPQSQRNRNRNRSRRLRQRAHTALTIPYAEGEGIEGFGKDHEYERTMRVLPRKNKMIPTSTFEMLERANPTAFRAQINRNNPAYGLPNGSSPQVNQLVENDEILLGRGKKSRRVKMVTNALPYNAVKNDPYLF